MRSLVVLLLISSAAAAQERAPSAGERAFLETSARESCFVEERVRVRLVVGVDREFFRKSGVPLFSRRMDLQVGVTVPWLEDLPGAIALPDAPPAGEGPSFALNDRVVRATRAADRVVDGRPFTVLTVERTYLLTRPGDIEIAAPTLRYAFATRFKEDFVHGRRPVDRREAVVRGEPRTLRVRPLPEEGRPDGFTGAVGRFTIRAEAAPADLAVGESLALSLVIEGEGNLSRFDPPRLDGLIGFHVYGAIDDRGAAVRTVQYDLSPTDRAVAGIPSIRLAYFDPGPGRYRTVETAPIPLSVEGAPAAGPEEATAPPAASRLLRVALVATAIALAALAAFALVLMRRGAARGRDEPPSPAEVFRARAGEPDADLTALFAEFLAAHLSCPAAAVIAPDLETRLASAGVPADLASRTAALLEALVAANYGGGASRTDEEAARALVEELEAAWGDGDPAG